MLKYYNPLFCSPLVLLLLLLLTGISANAQSEIHISNEFSLTYNEIKGPGSSSSSLTEKTHYLNVINLNSNGMIKKFDYSFNLGVQAADDRTNNPRTFSLINLQLKFTNKVHTFSTGDTFESFAQYSLSSALKGASYKYFNEERNSPEVTLVYGIAYPKWENVWHDPKAEAVKRQVYAGRIKHNFSSEFFTGINFVKSVDKKRLNGSELYNNNIYAMDMEYKPIKGLTLSTEAAIDNTETSPQEGADYSMSHGYAYKATAIGDGPPSRVTLEYEKVSPDFTTLLGAATPDREKAKMKWRYRATKKTTINTGFLWYRNDLKGLRSDGRTDHYKPDIGVTIKNILKRQYSAADISYKPDIARNNSITKKVNHITNLNYKDRFGSLDSDTNFGHTSYNSKDTSKSKEYTGNTTLSSRYSAGAFILKPSVYFGELTSKDELADITDRTYEYSAGLGADVPKLKITSDMKIGKYKLNKETGDDSKKDFANISIYYRPGFLEKLQGMAFVRAYINDFSYSTDSRNFGEKSITAGLNFQL
jgi:hypothetical protein